MNDLSYRGPLVPNFAEDAKPSVRDESDYSTLKKVQKTLEDAIFDLKENFNAFNVLNGDDPEVAVRKLLIDLKARQISYSIIMNVKADIDSAIERVDSLKSKE